MVININKTGQLLVLTALLFSSHVFAQQSESLLNFKFKHVSNIKNSDRVSVMDTDAQFVNTPQSLSNNQDLKFSQYDATWTYPWETKNVNIDLGLTLRHMTGIKSSSEGLDNTQFQQVLPLLHASALFNLPLKGLSAGIEGSHFGSTDSQIFDYRAKVSYEWRNGFGMQGGWQHQQFSLDNATNTGADYKRNGAFIDFYLNF